MNHKLAKLLEIVMVTALMTWAIIILVSTPHPCMSANPPVSCR